MTTAASRAVPRFAPRLTEEKRDSIRASVASGAALSIPFLAMNIAAALIAGFGLFENSPAVIIGAMLIAMLYGPIVGISMSLAEADMRLLGRALAAEIAGAACVLLVGFTLGSVTRDLTIGSEILSRTAPSGADLLIGLVGGVAGGFTFVSTGLSGVVVGVAISTALVPPLTTCGILLARQLPGEAGGAFLLFLANFAAITVGACVVLWSAGHRPRFAHGVVKPLLLRLAFLALLVGVGVHLNGTLRRASEKTTLQTNIRNALASEVVKIPGARLANVSMVTRDGRQTVWAVVRAPRPLAPAEVGRMNDVADSVAGVPLTLTVRSVLTAETTRHGDVYEPHDFPGGEP